MTRQLLQKSREKSRLFANVRYILDLGREETIECMHRACGTRTNYRVSLSLFLSLGGHRAFYFLKIRLPGEFVSAAERGERRRRRRDL